VSSIDLDTLEVGGALARALLDAERERADRAEARVGELEREVAELRALLSRSVSSLAERTTLAGDAA
jgi:uncharacterized protein YceH (UPF0502 family)